jgi:hypothetical protein
MSRKWKVMLAMCIAMLSLAVGVANAAAAGQPKAEVEVGGIAGTTFTGKGGAGRLETTTGNTASCTGNTSTGTINSATTINKVVVKFTGCSTVIGAFKTSCKSAGAAAGEIITNALKGELSYLFAGSSRTGIDLKPESATGDFVTFSCTLLGQTATLTARGSVIGELTPVNAKFGKTFELDLKQIGGMQEFTTTLNPENCKPVSDMPEIEARGAQSFPFTESGLEGNVTFTTSKNIKLVANTTDCP